MKCPHPANQAPDALTVKECVQRAECGCDFGTLDWLLGLTHKDWLRDAHPCSQEQWDALDWLTAWMDLSPSAAGNRGPYWHVMDKDGDCQHRMYPRIPEKWLPVVRRAIEEAVAKAGE
jgi:hypothetical protein